MKKQDDKRRFTLTLVYALAFFVVMMISVLIAAGLLYILVRVNAINTPDSTLEASEIILFMAFSSLLVGIFVSILTSEILLKPINYIISQINRLASGDFKARIKRGKFVNIHPIFTEVTDSFNKMASELENTEMLRADFINNFSHEFKTPIVSIAGFAKLVRKGNLSETQKTEYLEIIEKESLRLSYMATNVLNLTKVENQTILTEVSHFNLSEQIRGCVLFLEERWTKKNIELSIDLEEYYINANEELLKQVWINLLDNAVKFSPEDGVVGISIQPLKDCICVSITNTGSEISEDNIERIFNKFYQADKSRATEGHGVGLAIVKKIIELHDGEVKVDSNAERTVFTVTLPR